MNSYQQQADQIYNSLLDLEQNATQEQLFLCSYLLGHVSLISSEEGDNGEEFTQRVEESLQQAYTVDKLTDSDIQDINKLWQQLNGMA